MLKKEALGRDRECPWSVLGVVSFQWLVCGAIQGAHGEFCGDFFLAGETPSGKPSPFPFFPSTTTTHHPHPSPSARPPLPLAGTLGRGPKKFDACLFYFTYSRRGFVAFLSPFRSLANTPVTFPSGCMKLRNVTFRSLKLRIFAQWELIGQVLRKRFGFPGEMELTYHRHHRAHSAVRGTVSRSVTAVPRQSRRAPNKKRGGGEQQKRGGLCGGFGGERMTDETDRTS